MTADVVIVGAGFAGLGMAIALDKAGRRDYVIFEKASEIGGTWRENTYPGCACDIRSLLYSFSFEPKRDWSRQFPRRRFNAGLQRKLTGSVWTAGGCASWYLDTSGVNRALWPGSTVSYWWRTRRLSARDFEPAAGQAGRVIIGAAAAGEVAATGVTAR